jgi:hypothetical protein
MKKLLITSLCLFLIALGTKTCSASEYLAYQEVEFDYDCVKFIKNYTRTEKDDLYDLVYKGFWGWEVAHDNKDEKVRYKKETLYVILNEGESPITETFSLKQEEVTKKQYSVSGSIRLRGAGKDKVFSGSLDQKMDNSIDKTTTTTTLEEFDVKVNIDKGTVLHVEILGEGLLTNGVGKYFIFKKCIKKGAWEIFTVQTEYYSIRKEQIEGYIDPYNNIDNDEE